MSSQVKLELVDRSALSFAVIGAGIAGATAVRLLKEAGVGQVTLLDKGRRLGGRASSRLIEGYQFEFGASRISEEPKGWIAELQRFAPAQALSFEPRDPLVYKQASTNEVTGTSVRGGIEQLVSLQASLADQLERSARVMNLERECDEWWLYGHQYLADERGEHRKTERSWGPFDAVVVAIPSPQVAQLLFPHRAEWARAALKVRYEPAITLSVCFERPLPSISTPLPRAHPIYLLRQSLPAHAVDASAEGSDRRAWVFQMSASWSEERLERASDQLLSELLGCLEELLGLPPPAIVAHRVHRWRYASPLSSPETPGVLIDHSLALYVCGDWTLGSHGGWAFMSAQEVVSAALKGL